MLSGIKGYLTLMLGESISNIGSNLTLFVLNLWAWQKYGSAGSIAEVSLSFLLPQLLFTLFAGVFVDRWNRKMILVSSNVLLAGVMVVFATLMSTGTMELWHVYVLNLVHALFASFGQQALQSSLSLMVERKSLMRINGLTQMLNVIAPICAPLIGGILVGFMENYTLLVIDACTFVLIALSTLLVAVPQPQQQAEAKSGKKRNIFKDMYAGTHFLLQYRGLFYVVLTFSAYQLFRSTQQVLLLPMSSEVWQHDPSVGWINSMLVNIGFRNDSLDAQIYALTNALRWLGTFLGGMLVFGSRSGSKTRKTTTMVMGIMITGVSQMINGSSSLWLAIVAMLAGAAVSSVGRSAYMTIMMTKTPSEIQGRVFSTVSVFSQIGNPIGMALVMVFDSRLSSGALMFAGGVGTVVVALLSLLSHKMRHVEESEAPEEFRQTA